MFHQFPYAGALLTVAIGICLTAGWSVALLTAELSRTRTAGSPDWRHGALILSAGLGVWATHFSAMLAYRPDLTLSYAPGLTALSALIGIGLVGLPCAALTAVRRRGMRIALAALAGGGIWCMHAVGIAGMTNCQHSYSRTTNLIGAAAGIAAFVTWQARVRWPRPRIAGALFFAAAVCGTHFASLSGDIVRGHVAALHQTIFSPGLVAACIVFAVSVACLACLLTVAQIRSRREREGQALKAVIESMSDGLVFIDAGGSLRHFNRRFLHLFDTPVGLLAPGMTIDRFLDIVAHHRNWNPAKRDLVGGAMKTWAVSTDSFDRECEMEDGRTYLMQCRPVPSQGVVLTFNDVTAERQAMLDLSYLAHHDTLTGLHNRRALQDRTQAMLDEDARFSLLLMDLDEFKQVNDTFGHAVGDKLLIHCATLLRTMMAADSFVARMGGDEIAILVARDAGEALQVAQAIVERLATPVTIDGRRIVPGCSVGVAEWRRGLSAEDLMKRADMALYEAKRTGRRRARGYEAGLAERLLDRQAIIEGLHDAIQTGGFVLAFQPVVALGSGMTSGYEALIRWHHPVRGWVPPDLFIPIAEESGLIEEIGRWVIAEACRQLAGWSPHLHVAINVSAAQLCSDALLHHLSEAIAIHGLAPDRIEIEITETALMHDAATVAGCLERVRGMGVRIALDDFGTGQSSLSHLRDFRFDRIKIDRSFVVRAATDPRSMAVLRATAAIGHELGVLTHAEGVETREQVALLRSIGCDAIQGYFVGRPVIPTATDLRMEEAA